MPDRAQAYGIQSFTKLFKSDNKGYKFIYICKNNLLSSVSPSVLHKQKQITPMLVFNRLAYGCRLLMLPDVILETLVYAVLDIILVAMLDTR